MKPMFPVPNLSAFHFKVQRLLSGGKNDKEDRLGHSFHLDPWHVSLSSTVIFYWSFVHNALHQFVSFSTAQLSCHPFSIFFGLTFVYLLPGPAHVLEKYLVNVLGDGWIDEWMDLS